jgi:hypothetical protein
MRTKSLPFTCALILTLAACGPNDGSRLSGMAPKPDLYIGMSGFGTCKAKTYFGHRTPLTMKLFSPFKDLLDLSKNPKEYVAGCHDLLTGQWRYINSKDQKIIHGSRQELLDELKEAIQESNSDRQFLVGYSHGADLIMDALTDSYKGTDRFLFTIDPISSACNSKTIANLKLSPNINCTQAPASTDHSLGPLDYWANFYQTKSSYLHSSKVEDAHENFQIPMETYNYLSPRAHMDMDTHPGIWKLINQFVKKASGPNLSD